MKTCCRCKERKDEDCFYKRSSSSDGLHYICKICCKEASCLYYKDNKEKVLLKSKEWIINNKEKRVESQKKYKSLNKEYYLESVRKWRKSHQQDAVRRAIEWQKKNPEKCKASNKKWRENNQHVLRLISAERRLICRQSKPKWANKFFIREAYHLAKLRSETTGFMWHVDHVIPIKGKLVCGLHVETNLQVIPWIDNIRKSNKFVVF